MKEVEDADLVVERIAALDLGKAGLEACVRVPSPHRPGRRMQELRGYAPPRHNCWRWRPGCGNGRCNGW
jgi:hypothetical protein